MVSVVNTGGGLSAAAALVRVSQAAAGPAFELRFHALQNSVLDRMNKEIAALQEAKPSTAKTAHLEVRLKGLRKSLELVKEFQARTESTIPALEGVLAQLSELGSLAGQATTGGGGNGKGKGGGNGNGNGGGGGNGGGNQNAALVAEFEDKLAGAIADIESLPARSFEPFGAPNRLATVKREALAALESLQHNNFKKQKDVDAVQSALSDLGARFSASLEVTRINEDIAGRLIDSTAGKIGNAESAIDGIRLAEQRGRLDQITERRDYFSRVLTSLSLAFEASRNLTNYGANGAVLPQRTDRGSILDILR